MILYVEYINCQHRLHCDYYFLLTLRTRSAFPFRFFSSSPRILLFPPPPLFLSPPGETSSRCPHPAVTVGICSILRNIVGKYELQAVMLKRSDLAWSSICRSKYDLGHQIEEKSSGLQAADATLWTLFRMTVTSHKSQTLWRIRKSDKAVSNDEQHLWAAGPYLPLIGLRPPFNLCRSLYML